VLFRQRRASYQGEYVNFTDVESYPKAVQDPLPMLSGGNALGSRQRAGQYADGWLPACLTPAEIAAGMAEVRAAADEAGRELPADFDVAPQLSVAIGRTQTEAMATFESSQLYKHMLSLSQSTLKGRQADWAERNLIGTAEQMIDQIGRYAEAGVTTLSGLLFASNDISHTIDQVSEFAETVIAVVNKDSRASVARTQE
jgi:alkanesulfonate monooxygenase SsuD/methylene tetrahydromethanopterin reductase-like flavin-dependent oxidoreductase (luciferase family)